MVERGGNMAHYRGTRLCGCVQLLGLDSVWPDLCARGALCVKIAWTGLYYSYVRSVGLDSVQRHFHDSKPFCCASDALGRWFGRWHVLLVQSEQCWSGASSWE
jgi:hypothetical protein